MVLKRIRAFFASPDTDPVVASLYRACVSQARQPVFYEKYGVPDTIDGRFDLLLLHVWIVMRKLNSMPVKQKLFDLMFSDMDRSLREMGVGDMSIRKKMKPMIQAFYGRVQAYERALTTDNMALESALRRNLYGAVPVSDQEAQWVGAYVREAMDGLDRQTPDALLLGQVCFPTLNGGLISL